MTDESTPTLAHEVYATVEQCKAAGMTTAEAYRAAATYYGRTNAEIRAAYWMRDRDTAVAFPDSPSAETDIALLRAAGHALADRALEQLDYRVDVVCRRAEEAKVAAEQMAAYTDAKRLEIMRQLEELN